MIPLFSKQKTVITGKKKNKKKPHPALSKERTSERYVDKEPQ